MPVSPARLALAAVALACAVAPVSAQKPPARVVTYDDVLVRVRAGDPPADVLAACDVVFTLSQDQRDELKLAGAPAALVSALQTRRIAIGDVTDFVVVLDCSGSMKDEIGPGVTKMDAARKVVGDLFKAVPTGRNLAFVVYGHDAALECKAVKVVRPLGPVTAAARAELAAALGGLAPAGHTPIAASLRAAGAALDAATGPSQVVVITDGVETCHGDPAAEAEGLTARVKGLRSVEVVGVGLKTPEEKAAVAAVARRGRGRFYDADTADELRKAVEVAADVPADKPGAADGAFAPKKVHDIKGHTEPVTAVAFSPDGRLLATASRDKTVRLWDVKTGERVQRIPNQDEALCAAFSPDGKRVAVGGGEGVFVYDAATGDRAQRLKTGYPVVLLAWSPDGSRLAAAAPDARDADLWDVAAGTRAHVLKGHGRAVNELAFSPDGKLLATAADDETVRLWDTATGAEKDSLKAHSGPVGAVAFSADGATLVTGGDDQTVVRWNVKTGNVIKPVLELAKTEYGGVRRAALLPNGRVWAARAVAGDVVFDPASGKVVAESPAFKGVVPTWGWGKGYRNKRVALTADGKTLAVVDGNDVAVYDTSREFGATPR